MMKIKGHPKQYCNQICIRNLKADYFLSLILISEADFLNVVEIMI